MVSLVINTELLDLKKYLEAGYSMILVKENMGDQHGTLFLFKEEHMRKIICVGRACLSIKENNILQLNEGYKYIKPIKPGEWRMSNSIINDYALLLILEKFLRSRKSNNSQSLNTSRLYYYKIDGLYWPCIYSLPNHVTCLDVDNDNQIRIKLVSKETIQNNELIMIDMPQYIGEKYNNPGSLGFGHDVYVELLKSTIEYLISLNYVHVFGRKCGENIELKILVRHPLFKNISRILLDSKNGKKGWLRVTLGGSPKQFINENVIKMINQSLEQWWLGH